MMIHDQTIVEAIEKVAEHYNSNIATRFLRPSLAGILSDTDLARRISDMTEHSETVASQGVHIDELYSQIHAMARFIYLVRLEVLPNLRSLSGVSQGKATDSNHVYREMAMNNFGANLKILADYVNELYMKTVNFDKAKAGTGKPVYRSIPGLEEIGRYLVQR